MQSQDLINVPVGFNVNYYYNQKTQKLYLRSPKKQSHGQYDYQEINMTQQGYYYLYSYDRSEHRISKTTLLRLINPKYNINNYIPIKSAFTPYNYRAVAAYLTHHHYILPKRYRVISQNCKYIYAFKQKDLDQLNKLKKVYLKNHHNPDSFTALRFLPKYYDYYYDPTTDTLYNLAGRRLNKCRNGTYALTINQTKKYVSVNKIKKALQI